MEQIRHITWIILLLYSFIKFYYYIKHFYCLFTNSSKSKMIAQSHIACHLDGGSNHVQRHYSLTNCESLYQDKPYVLRVKSYWETVSSNLQFAKVHEFPPLSLFYWTNTVICPEVTYLNVNILSREANTLIF